MRLFDRSVVYRDPDTFGEYQLSYRSGDILSPTVESYEPLGLEPLPFHACLARSVVRIVEAADESLRAGGSERALDHVKMSEPLSAIRGMAFA